jgi:hypothetical protein
VTWLRVAANANEETEAVDPECGLLIGTTLLLRLAAVTFTWKTRAARPLLGKRAS